MRSAFLIGCLLGLAGCAGLTQGEKDAIKTPVVAGATAFFGPLGGLIADHSMELLLGGYLVKRKLGERKRYEKVVKSVLKPPATSNETVSV